MAEETLNREGNLSFFYNKCEILCGWSARDFIRKGIWVNAERCHSARNPITKRHWVTKRGSLLPNIQQAQDYGNYNYNIT